MMVELEMNRLYQVLFGSYRRVQLVCVALMAFVAVGPQYLEQHAQAFLILSPLRTHRATANVKPSYYLRGAALSETGVDLHQSAQGLMVAAVCSGLAVIVAARQSRRRTCPRARLAVLPDRDVEGRNPDATVLGAVKSDVAPQFVTDVDPSEGPTGTYQVGIDFKNWLASATEEITVDDLDIEGTLPAWLRGTLIHAGPAKFEFGPDEFVDWVDGQAMMYRLRILGDGQCEYRNRWLDTSNHRAHRAAGRISVRETCSRPSLPTFWERFFYMFEPPNNENGNLHISPMVGGTRPVSMSVGSSILEFTLDDMKTLGKVPFDDDISKQTRGPLIFHAEPHIDNETGEWFTCAVQLFPDIEKMTDGGYKPEYVVFSVEPTNSQEPGAVVNRRTITRIKTDYPSPIHTICLTPRYLTLVQIPYPLNWDGILNAEARWLATGMYEGNLNDYNTWQPERPTIIRVIDRVTGEHTATFETDPFFFFHIVNSYEAVEDGSDVMYIDLVAYEEPPVGFPLRQARSGDVEDWRGGGGDVRRLRLDFKTNECTWTGWPDNCFDEPKVNPKVDGQQYVYSYGVQDDNGMLRLCKLNHDNHEIVYWEEQDVTRELPWQPVFVPEPYNEKEDAGVLMSFVRDQPTGNTFCVVIDAESFKEKARIHFPKGHHIPLHGHGTWMQGQF